MEQRVLLNQHIAVETGSAEEQGEGNGQPKIVPRWALVFTDRASGDQTRISFGQQARDEIVRQLTGGVVLAGGDLPKL